MTGKNASEEIDSETSTEVSKIYENNTIQQVVDFKREEVKQMLREQEEAA